jgi:hypothetical protein
MAKTGLNIYLSGYTGKLLIVWKEVQQGNPTPPETGRSDAFDFPYDDVYTINNINPTVHIVELWRSTNGTALSELIKRWEIDPSLVNATQLVRYQYHVGRADSGGTIGNGDYWADPNDGDTDLVDERLNGATQDDLRVHEAGYGDRANDEYELLTGGGIRLLGTGVQFNQDTRWFIEYFTIIQLQSVVTTTAPYTDVVVLANDDDFYTDANTNYYNKLVIVDSSSPTVRLSFPDLDTIPNNTRVRFNTHQGSQNYLELAFDAGDSVNYLGVARNKIYIAKCEEFALYFKNGVCYVEKGADRGLFRGDIWGSLDSSKYTDTGAFLLADETTGELSGDDYPGLYEFIENLPAGHSCALGTGAGQWSQAVVVNTGKINQETTYPNKTKYGINTGTRTFRVPHLKNLSRRFVNTGQNPGRYQHDAVGKFEADVTLSKSHTYTGGPNNTVIGNGQDNANKQDKLIPMKVDTGSTENITRNFGETPFVVL